MNEWYVKEEFLMSAAIIIQSEFSEMIGELNMNKVASISTETQIKIFCDWARDFVIKYKGTKEFLNDFTGMAKKYATEKISLLFG